MPWRAWLALVRPGDYLILLLAVAATVLAGLRLWGPDRPSLAVVRAGGKAIRVVDAHLSLELGRAA